MTTSRISTELYGGRASPGCGRRLDEGLCRVRGGAVGTLKTAVGCGCGSAEMGARRAAQSAGWRRAKSSGRAGQFWEEKT